MHYHPDTTPDSRGIHKYALHPARILTASLGRELEKYDQICDIIESHLVSIHPDSIVEFLSCQSRAVSVLKRDLTRELRSSDSVPLHLRSRSSICIPQVVPL